MDAREGVILVLGSLSGEHHVSGTVVLLPELLGILDDPSLLGQAPGLP